VTRLPRVKVVKMNWEQLSIRRHSSSWYTEYIVVNEELNQPDGEEEVVGDGERLKQKYCDGGRFGVVTDDKN